MRPASRSNEVFDLEQRLEDLSEARKGAVGPAAAALDAEILRVSLAVLDVTLKERRSEIQSLSGKTDSESMRKRLEVQRSEAYLQAKQAELQGNKQAAAAHYRRSSSFDAPIDRMWREKFAKEERAAVGGGLANLPWVSARPPSDPIAPNACSTCADAPQRFDKDRLEAVRLSKPITAGKAREDIAKRWPAYVKPGPMTTRSHTAKQLEHSCGKETGGCAHMGSEIVYLPHSPTNSAVNHETLHALTSPEWGKRVPATVNESVTEYFNRKMGHFPAGGHVQPKAYEGGQPLLNAWIQAKPAREDALARAYFTGDFSALEALEDKPAFGRVPAANVIDKRFSGWNDMLKNSLPGSSLTIDDERILQRAAQGGPR